MNIVIRPLAPADEAQWRRLWTGYLEFYETQVPDEVYASTFARMMPDGHPDMHGLAAEREDAPGEMIGLVHYLFHRHTWKVEDTLYLQDLYVDPAIRGGGVGRALIEAVYQAGDEAGCPSVYWLTQEFNYRGRMLYDQVGARTPFIVYRR